MLTRDGKKWISTTNEGCFEVDESTAHYNIPVRLIELLQNTNEYNGVENANEAIRLYNISQDLYNCENYNQNMVCTCLKPVLDQLAIEGKYARIYEPVARYVVREAWYSITVHGNTEMLNMLYDFYRDQIFPLILKDRLYKCEQFMRITRAFTAETGMIIKEKMRENTESILSRTDEHNYSLETAAREFHYRKYHGTKCEYDIFVEPILIPAMLAEKAREMHNNGYLFSEERKKTYISTLELTEVYNGFEKFHDAESAFEAFTMDFRRIGKKAYKKAYKMGWKSFCFELATLCAMDNLRIKIANEFTDEMVIWYGVSRKWKIGNTYDLVMGTLGLVVSVAVLVITTLLVIAFTQEYGIIVGPILGCVASYPIMGIVTDPVSRSRNRILASGGHISISERGHIYVWK